MSHTLLIVLLPYWKGTQLYFETAKLVNDLALPPKHRNGVENA